MSELTFLMLLLQRTRITGSTWLIDLYIAPQMHGHTLHFVLCRPHGEIGYQPLSYAEIAVPVDRDKLVGILTEWLAYSLTSNEVTEATGLVIPAIIALERAERGRGMSFYLLVPLDD